MISIIMEFPDLAEKLTKAQGEITREIVVAIQTNRGLLFDNEGNYNGHDAWDALSLRSGQILAQRGVLKKSIAPMNGTGQPGPGGYVNMDGAGTVRVGTNVAYAAMMNFGTTNMPGGVLRPTHAKALRIPLPKGKAASDKADDIKVGQRRAKIKKGKKLGRKDEYYIFAKWVKIPARRFDTITSQDQAEFVEAITTAIAEALR